MFLSYEYIGHSKSGGANVFKIIDSDFYVFFEDIKGGRRLILTIIEEYEKRNLNVAANVVLAIRFRERRERRNSQYTAKSVIEKHNDLPEFRKYEKDINKYLLLI